MNDKDSNKGISGKPFLKWPGGKRWVTESIKSIIKVGGYRRYLEPFLGGGALFFALAPDYSILSDINEELIVTYQQVRDQPDKLIRKLRKIPVNLVTYNKMRNQKPVEPLDQAVRFLYLNRTAFAGMYRVNRKGEFNVPFGGGQRTPACLWEEGLLTTASEALGKANIICCDFKDVVKDAHRGDLVYCDPTYTTSHSNNGFIRYNENNFSWKDQEELALASRRAANRGATVIVSNACNKDIRKLYSGANMLRLTRLSLICPDVSKRKSVEEYLFIYNK
jgi:DNA adenine methylase